MIVFRMGPAATGEGRMRSDLAKDQGEGSEFNLPVGTHVVNVENGTECLPLLIKCSTKERSLVSEVDKAIRLSIRIVIWILPSDTVFANSTKISANTETAMLSTMNELRIC